MELVRTLAEADESRGPDPVPSLFELLRHALPTPTAVPGAVNQEEAAHPAIDDSAFTVSARV
jgi:hypothetical protein